MHASKRKYIIPIVAAVILLLLLSLITRIGTASPLLLDFTPSAYAYLPFLSKQATPTSTTIPTFTPIPPDDINNEQSIAVLLNQQRDLDLNELASLTLVSELTQAARRHSRDMADQNFTSHTGSDDSNGGQRMQEASYNWTTWGEIIGWGFDGDSESMVNWWMDSPTHKSLILSSSFNDFGVGYAENPDSDWGHYWTVNFGTRVIQATALPQELYVCTFSSQGTSGGSSLIIYSSEPCQ